ncbi:twin-arginine translocase subunit TatB [Halomonas sp. MCCC 1A17488]|uniref:Sec-independent protein translocase protein TatB n=1 Tax=Billgrantia sulfidoxydans TaxID=2733484 RepID=A0ABX7W0B5_9GAMM|nr:MULTISPECIES: Sec-independent protein translocase protein TatB [Halomonas]MCE8016720.1 twin-arginine translocase subunit TatB [Halomonas sp. MCCC 1A17488]MCG3240053.1 twin-arginine translocase subunit TatB [Halomonas sp. MCCC 1A17488]QPP50064.1 twin-arginine translocase subunit TatB [Halomonas sp. SS10-MC5]QTP53675.1 twin-arginine translocase subunit TatB [Halomonas sulfidoxydans]
MFDIGFLELLVLGIVGLLVLGPERLPKAARTVGLWVGKIKRTVSSMQREINSQLEAEELRQKLKEQQAKLDESLSKAKRDVESIADPAPTPGQADAKRSAEGDGEATPPASARLDDALADARAAGSEPPSPSDDDKDAASR